LPWLACIWRHHPANVCYLRTVYIQVDGLRTVVVHPTGGLAK
jgi:hypothetical protein